MSTNQFCIVFLKGCKLAFLSDRLILSFYVYFYHNRKLLPCEKNGRFKIQYWLLTCDIPNDFYSGRLDLLIFSSSKFFGFFSFEFSCFNVFEILYFCGSNLSMQQFYYVSVCCVILVDHHALVVFLALLSFYDSLGAEQSNDNNCKVLSFDISLNKTLSTLLGPTFILVNVVSSNICFAHVCFIQSSFCQTIILSGFFLSEVHFV